MSTSTLQPTEKLLQQYRTKLMQSMAAVPAMQNSTVAQMTDSIATYLDEHPQADYSDLVQVFGTPEQAAECLLNDMDAEQIKNALASYRWKKQFLILAAGILAAVLIWFAGINFSRFIGDRIPEPYLIYPSNSAGQSFP